MQKTKGKADPKLTLDLLKKLDRIISWLIFP